MILIYVEWNVRKGGRGRLALFADGLDSLLYGLCLEEYRSE